MTGLVLCGGNSERMGRDKAFLELDGKTLLQLQVARLEAAGCDEVLISGPRGRGYEAAGKRLVEDEVCGAGPLAGLCAGLKAARGVHVLAVAVDLPGLTVDFLRWLREEAGDRDMMCPESERGYEPLCAVYRRSVCLPIMQQRLAENRLSLQEIVQQIARDAKARIILPREWKVWGETLLRNWNEP